MHKDINVNVSGPVQPTSTYKTKVLKGNQSFAFQVTEPNMKYVIKHDFDLGSESVTIPENCVLEFDGGSISNGSLVCNDTYILAEPINIFKNIVFSGSVTNSHGDIAWFGGKQSLTYNSYGALLELIKFSNSLNLYISILGDYLFRKTDNNVIYINNGIDFNNSNILFDCNIYKDFQFVIKGTSEETEDSLLQSAIKKIIENRLTTIYHSSITAEETLAFEALEGSYIQIAVNEQGKIPQNVETVRLTIDNRTWYKYESFYLDTAGNIEGYFWNDSFPSEDTILTIYRNTNKSYYVRGGNFSFAKDSVDVPLGSYRSLGFKIDGVCNGELSSINFDLRNIEGWTRSFIRIENSYNSVIQNINCVGLTDTGSESSSYAFGLRATLNTLVYNVIFPIGNNNVWGLMGSNLTVNTNFVGCQFNRFDSHYRGINIKINDCTIGRYGIQVTGGGYLDVKNCIAYCNTLINLRDDYGTEWRGDISVDNIFTYNRYFTVLSVGNNNSNVTLHPNDEMGFIPAGNNLVIDNIKCYIDDSMPSTINAINVGHIYEQRKTKLPNITVRNISCNNNNKNLRVLFDSYGQLTKIHQGFNNLDTEMTLSDIWQDVANYNINIELFNLHNFKQILLVYSASFDDMISSYDNSELVDKSTVIVPYVFADNVDTIVNGSSLPFTYFNLRYCKIDGGIYPETGVSGCVFQYKYAYNNCVIKLDGSNDYIKNYISLGRLSACKSKISIASSTFDCDAINTTITNNPLKNYFFTWEDNTFTPVSVFIYPFLISFGNKISNNLEIELQKAHDTLVAGGYKSFEVSDIERYLKNSDSYFKIFDTSNYADAIISVSVATLFDGIKALFNWREVKLHTTQWLGEDGVVIKYDTTTGTASYSRKTGSTTQRPTAVNTGFMYFDVASNMKKPVWWNGTSWVDALGNATTTVYPKVIGTPIDGNLAKFDANKNIKDAGVAPQV